MKYLDYMKDFIVDGDASASEYGAGSFPRNFDTGIRSTSWVKAYHVLKDSLSMDVQANTDILKTFWKKGTYLNTPGGFSPVGNHGMVETEGYIPLDYISQSLLIQQLGCPRPILDLII